MSGNLLFKKSNKIIFWVDFNCKQIILSVNISNSGFEVIVKIYLKKSRLFFIVQIQLRFPNKKLWVVDNLL